jgi:hypothetical protein
MNIYRTYVGLIGFVILIVACAKPKDFDYLGLQNVKVLKWGVKETILGLDVQFYNPNSRLQLKKADVDVHINNKFWGRTVIDSLVNIPKKDTFILPMIMTMETVTALSGVLQSIADTSVLLKLDGKAMVGKSGVFFNYPIKYEGNQKMTKIIAGENAH